MSDLINIIKDVFGDRPNLKPYNFSKVEIFLGIPPMPMKGVEYIYSQHEAPQVVKRQCLTGKGIFLNNQNHGGIIEIGCLNGSASFAAVQIFELIGIPYPIVATDLTTGATSTTLATECRRIGTPQWRRGRMPDIDIYTFATPNLFISDGLRLAE